VSERVRHPRRDYVFYRRPIEVAAAALDSFGGTPSSNLWWPQDRAWMVAAEIDYAWAYAGGRSHLIEMVRASDGLEALRSGSPTSPPTTVMSSTRRSITVREVP
jgi:hypothetical protein